MAKARKPKDIEVPLEVLWRLVRDPKPDDAVQELILQGLLDHFGTDVMVWCQRRTYNAIKKRKSPDPPRLAMSTYDGTISQLAKLVGRIPGRDLVDFDKKLETVEKELGEDSSEAFLRLLAEED
jgi:hypothetical protein